MTSCSSRNVYYGRIRPKIYKKIIYDHSRRYVYYGRIRPKIYEKIIYDTTVEETFTSRIYLFVSCKVEKL